MRRLALAVVFTICLIALITPVIAGCSGSDNSNSGGMMGGSGSSTMPSGGSNASPGGGMTGGSASSTNSYSSAGARIYFTCVGADGQKIAHTAPAVAQGSLMMGGGGCASCHGADGRGGTIRLMMGAAVEAPDITYDALIKEGFSHATIGRAIRDGLDESGKPLKDAMPRWQMRDADVAEVIAYLKRLSAP